MKNQAKGFALPMMIAIMLVIAIFLPALISWIQQDTKSTIRTTKSTTAFNLAEAGIDRGMWKLKSSTSTYSKAKVGTAVAGYDFDATYNDIPGGRYRIRFSSGPTTRDVTVVAEGRDQGSQETRAIQAVFSNQSFPGAMISGGVITWANAFSAHWGAIMAHNNIDITDANAAQDFFPRKYSKQVVQTTIGSYDRDINGLSLPNTDNTEWWSDYDVPELPILDFSALKSSATATGTLNVYGCSKMPGYAGPWWGKNACNLGGKNHAGSPHFQNSYNHPDARKGYVWYWDSDVIFTGGPGSEGNGIWGSVISRGNLTSYAGDNYTYTGPVPTKAWEEYGKISSKVGDTAANNEYPADDGYQKNRATFNFGGETWTGGKNPPTAANTDIGVRGLLYVGGDLSIEGPIDVNGVVWVAGNVNKATGSERTFIFFDDTVDVPTLNVVLVRKSWKEIPPSSTPWL